MNPVRASNLDDFIPFLIAIVWVIAQIAGAAAKKKRALPSFGEKPQDSPRPVEPGGRRPGDSFAELLRQLGGGEEFRIPAPQFDEDLPETPALSHRNPIKTEVPPPEKTFQPLETPDARIKQPQVEIEVRPKMSAFRNSTPSIKLPSASLRIDSPSYAEASRGKQGLGDELHLNSRKALRRAMLSHIIFSPPKALEK